MSMGWCCPHPLAPLSRKAGEGGLWSAEAQLPPTLKLTLQHSKQVSVRPYTPRPRSGRGEPRAKAFGVLKRQLQRWAEAPLPHSISPAPACGRGGHRG